MRVEIPELALVLLIGPSGCGKTTFAKRHFLDYEVISSDQCRGWVSNDETDQSASNDAFKLLYYLVDVRLRRGLLTVIDATNVSVEDRSGLIALARRHHCFAVGIIFNLPEALCVERNSQRTDRTFGPHVIYRQKQLLRKGLGRIRFEGFRSCIEFKDQEQVERAEIVRTPLWNNRKSEKGPFDIIGDLHGCCDELEELLEQLGYSWVDCPKPEGSELYMEQVPKHPQGRRAIFVGDYIDRGPRSVDTLRMVATMSYHGSAFCLPGNHDVKLLRLLNGSQVQIKHGLAETLADFDRLPAVARAKFESELKPFIEGLVSHLIFDEGKLVVAHAGLKLEYHGRTSGRVREFCLYGDTTGEVDEFGLPVRLDWASGYRGEARVVYGHTPVARPEWLNCTANIDTGCVFGGHLTALRYPENEFVSVPARRVYCEPTKRFVEQTSPLSAQQEFDNLLDIDDVLGKRIVSTELISNVTIREENGIAAIETLSRFAVDPRWLIYLPPTMSPCETSQENGLLEYPSEAFEYFRAQGVRQVVCQEKHMGSRAVVVLCKDHKAATQRFGIDHGQTGVIYTRTGRSFLADEQTEQALLDRLRGACERSGFWEKFGTDWVCLDCELMPWSAKALELLKTQYAAVGAAGRMNLVPVVDSLVEAKKRLEDPRQRQLLGELESRFANQRASVDRFVDAYRRYCWQVESLDDWSLAPFHLLATEGKVHTDKDHVWHMEELRALCSADSEILLATDYLQVDVTDDTSIQRGVDWWQTKTHAGAEGMVVKPIQWVVSGKTGLVQPAVKCRGKEYLRIIYGPDYDTQENLDRLRKRGLGRKRSLALREFALGLEGLKRFVKREPLRKVHECVFGVLALESEPVDPRL
ncbi:MAG: polynucleotide kinase-phosphatase [Planctomycetota bacterium]